SFTIFLVILGSALILDNIGLNVSALVAGIGVVGIAVGLGAQTLIKDVINGTFILIEDQYSVGDVVAVAGVSGEVVAINPRRTVVRDMNGSLHSIPNGAITVATNMTQGFSRINLNLSLPGTHDITRITKLIDAVGEELAKERPEDLLSAPHVLRIDAIGETRVELKVVGDTRAGKQWELTGELRRRLLERLQAEGIDIFVPRLPGQEEG
ncbi:MAG TPA: mechanosensitive ion channel domain-containing protein, partial [Tepidiformaceae bacterium]